MKCGLLSQEYPLGAINFLLLSHQIRCDFSFSILNLNPLSVVDNEKIITARETLLTIVYVTDMLSCCEKPCVFERRGIYSKILKSWL